MNFKVIDNILYISYVFDNIEYKNEYDIRIMDKNIMNNLSLIIKSNFIIEQNNNTIVIKYSYINPLTSRNIDVNFTLYNSTLGKNEALLLRKEFINEIDTIYKKIDDINEHNIMNRENLKDIVHNSVQESKNLQKFADELIEMKEKQEKTKEIKKMKIEIRTIKSKITRLFWLLNRVEREHYY